MAMDIMLLPAVLATLAIAPIFCEDIYMCSWPTNEVIQLRCDYINCPYLSVDKIIVGRLYGHPSSCMEFNANKTLRKPISSCNYQLMETHDFFGQVKNNCSRKQVCQISSEEVFQTAGICGREVGQPDSIRNWIHIRHSCYGDIPGVKCKREQPSTTMKPLRLTNPQMTKVRRIGTSRPSQDSVTKSKKSSGVAVIIPILATLLFCTLLLIVATMLYRHGVCQRRSWKQTVHNHINQRLSHQHSAKAQIKLDELRFNIDCSKLRELERRLNRNQVFSSTPNDYSHDLSFPNTTLNRSQQKELINDVKMRTASRRGRRGSLDLPSSTPVPPLPTTDMYFSDTSESTTTTEQEFGSNDRRKRRRVKPLPPLPRPVVSHSEVYFTETETESEAPRRVPRRKEPLPKLDPPPKVTREKPKYDRVRVHKPHQHSNSDTHHSNGNGHRQSLELALTKGAAKKLNLSTSHDNKVKVMCKKPMARPRATRSSTSLYGNILMDENMISHAGSTNNNLAKRSHTLPVQCDYRNVTNG